MARRGFTLTEVLIATALGALVLGVAMQQVIAYQRVQSRLMVRTQLRHEVQRAQEHLARKLRYATWFSAVPDGYMAIVPLDSCKDGYLCSVDSLEITWWRLAPHPFRKGPGALEEHTVVLPAFEPPAALSEVMRAFGKVLPARRTLLGSASAFELGRVGPRTYYSRLTGERQVPNAAPVHVTLQERVAVRSQPLALGLPSFEKRLKELGL